MGFNLFGAKPKPQVKTDFKLHKVFNEVFSFFESSYPEDVESCKNEFVNLTGPFDEEHEYFEAKLDDFRSWFLFFHGGVLFQNLEKIEKDQNLGKYYDYLLSGVFSVFTVQKVKGDDIFVKDLFDGALYTVNDPVSSLSLEKGSCLQTSLYFKEDDKYRFGMSIVSHPVESLKYIRKKIKEVGKKKGISKEELFQRLIGMRYQFFKYRQLEVNQIYSDKSLIYEKISDVKK